MPCNVLVIDDERGLSQVLAIRLRAAGFTVALAGNGLSGLASAQADPPDAVVLDIRMPDIDGFEVNARLKQDPQLAGIPVVFLSANVQDSARNEALAAGAFAYITKPYDQHQVIATLREAISSRKAGRSISHA